ncbi:exosortase-associated protein EpsI, V-type [Sphingomonas sp. Tas61C01]|uniref:exosortase-associated protein EpsI, V-type n=1 Tax=Sphingomonas sp. Tas61C01 TaxID=3458297 RepID=UPI00403E9EC0
MASSAQDPLSRRKMMIGMALAGTVALSELYVPKRSMPRLTEKSFTAMFPTTIGPWSYLTASGLILPPEDQLSRTLYEQLLTRTYASGDADPVMMVLAYSSIQEGRLQVHRPEVCYPASGFAILDNEPTEVKINDKFTLPARFLIADRGARREFILYWTRVGPDVPTRWFDQRLMMAKANLKGYIPDGMLARVSVIGNDRDEAMKTLQDFVRTLVGSVDRQARTLLIGPH